jgi:hypothetical protein
MSLTPEQIAAIQARARADAQRAAQADEERVRQAGLEMTPTLKQALMQQSLEGNLARFIQDMVAALPSEEASSEGGAYQ